MELQRQRARGDLLSLPQELLQRILEEAPGTPHKLRVTCKAFASAVGSSGLVLRRAALVGKGVRREVAEALTAFPKARRVVLDLQGGRGGAAAPADGRGRAPWCGVPRTCDQDLLCESLAALDDRGVTSLGLLQLGCAPPLALPAHLQASLLELEISDASYTYAAEQGACNLIVRGSSDVVPRTAAMVRLALTLPHLRRLSLAAASFTADSVLALGALTLLESLSIAGSLECPGGAAQAAAVHRSLLGSLPALRQLRLPLAVATGAASVMADDDGSDDEVEFAEDQGLWGHMAVAGGGSGGNTTPPAAAPQGAALVGVAGAAIPGRGDNGTPWASGAAGVPLALATPLRFHTNASGRRRGGGGSLLRQHEPRQQHASGGNPDSATGFVFPPHLHDLTIPLCALNRPTFEAVCAAYRLGSASGGSGSNAPDAGATGTPAAANPAGGGSLRSLHIPSLAGYSRWEGSFLTCDRDFELLAGLGGLEVLHVSLELGAFRRPSPADLRGCFQRLRALRELRELRITETQQPVCFSPRKRSCITRSTSVFGQPSPPTLSGPALAKLQQQWPQLQSLQFFGETVVRAGSVRVVVVVPFPDAAGVPPVRPSDPLAVRHVFLVFGTEDASCARRELRITETQQPVCFSPRKRSCTTRSTAGVFGQPSPPTLSGPALAKLQQQWPQLQSLQFFGETVVRCGGRLVVPGWEEADLLPAACACCSGPHLLAAAPRSRGRAGSVRVVVALSQELLQRILEETPGTPRKLRVTCKAFASAVGSSGLVLRRAALVGKGVRREVAEALTAFPKARRVVLDLQGGRGGAAAPADGRGRAPWRGVPRTCDQDLLCESLAALDDRGVTSLGLLQLSCAPPLALPAHLQASLLELEVSDASYTYAAEQGACNLIALGSSEVVPRTAAMVRLALTLPHLRRLSLAAASFTADSVLALGALTQLESLSIAGSLECPGGAAQAAAVHRSLLGSLPALRQLRLPLAVATGAASVMADDDGSDDEVEFAEDQGLWGHMAVAGGGSDGNATPPAAAPGGGDNGTPWASGAAGVPLVLAAPLRCHTNASGSRRGGGGSLLRQHEPRQHRASGGNLDAATGFVFPPHLHDLTIPLCALNRPTFEAVCAAYRLGSASNAPDAGATGTPAAATPAGGGSLRSLHIPSLAGYSRWEGSFLTCDRDFELLAGLGGLEVLHVSLELGAFRRPSPVNLRGCFQRLRALRELRELRITETQQPVCFSPRKRSCITRSTSVFGQPSPPTLSGPALAKLQQQWPLLQSLQFFGETVVRCGGRLVVPGWEEADLLPAACACCSGPHLLAAAPRSRG
ncbi:hypothetical protein TSOC_011791, partial [Tetrabaena socialis]